MQIRKGNPCQHHLIIFFTNEKKNVIPNIEIDKELHLYVFPSQVLCRNFKCKKK
jgi:hypothetical protein